ncbi:MAG: heparinase II/III family protein [Rhodospirillales bacterium]|nr:heparinase II/III family protein [Rhodospirillales bacterium]
MDGYIPSDSWSKLSEQICSHKFDLLGSGLKSVNRQSGINGQTTFPKSGSWLNAEINRANRSKSRKIWQLIFQGPWAANTYTPINWQVDFKSNARWDSRTWYMDVAIGAKLDADIKVPWELARLQHLPQLAISVCIAKSENHDLEVGSVKNLVAEIRAQILDFVATNPPRFGIHWRTPMEAAIRGANILLSLDILHSAGVVLDRAAMEVIEGFIVAQTRHILANLEWSEQARGNHYYANILGVLFAGCYLPDTPEVSVWRAFAVHQLVLETDRQFLDDGGNFEGSTGYHRLTLEMALYGVALTVGFDGEQISQLKSYQKSLLSVRPPFPSSPLRLYSDEERVTPYPQKVREKIYKAICFLSDITRPDHRYTQIGDVDSSRLFKLQPIMRHGREDTVNPAGVISASAGLTSDICEEQNHLDQFVIRQLAKQKKITFFDGKDKRYSAESFHTVAAKFLKEFKESDNRCKRKIIIPNPKGISDNVRFASYPEFGLFLLKEKEFYLSIRCFDPTKGGAWGHAHDDNLSIELVVDGKSVITDPGSFTYTANPKLRQLYRDAKSHFVPRVINCPAANIADDLFEIKHLAKAECIYFGPEGFVGRLVGADWIVERMVVLSSNSIEIFDRTNGAKIEPLHVLDAKHNISDGYGRETKSPICAF